MTYAHYLGIWKKLRIEMVRRTWITKNENYSLNIYDHKKKKELGSVRAGKALENFFLASKFCA
jgi:hypothetical protein